MTRYKLNYDNALVEEGSPERMDRIRRVFDRAVAGEAITVGFLGGSITQGSVATDDKLCYAYRVYEWFRKTFPKSDITYVNAGIGATDSEYAAARVQEHLLAHNPDFVLMEHSVNDECEEHFKETYEGTLRQILKSKPDIAVMLMANVFYNDGANSERIHRPVARHYGVPMVSMRTTIYDAILRGEIADNREITPDDLHPNDAGHALVAEVICHFLEGIKDGSSGDSDLREKRSDGLKETPLQSGESPAAIRRDPADDNSEEIMIPAPLTRNRYEYSIKYDNRNSGNVLRASEGFQADERPREAVRDCFKEGYTATDKGSFMEYEVEGSCIAVQYRRTINLPAPKAVVLIDGKPVTVQGAEPSKDGSADGEVPLLILDANFDETWGDKLVLTDVYMSERSEKHTVRIEITESPDDLRGDFYLAGIIVSQ